MKIDDIKETLVAMNKVLDKFNRTFALAKIFTHTDPRIIEGAINKGAVLSPDSKKLFQDIYELAKESALKIADIEDKIKKLLEEI